MQRSHPRTVPYTHVKAEAPGAAGTIYRRKLPEELVRASLQKPRITPVNPDSPIQVPGIPSERLPSLLPDRITMAMALEPAPLAWRLEWRRDDTAGIYALVYRVLCCVRPEYNADSP